eukprot:3827749-Rhodomonas_salina.1
MPLNSARRRLDRMRLRGYSSRGRTTGSRIGPRWWLLRAFPLMLPSFLHDLQVAATKSPTC